MRTRKKYPVDKALTNIPLKAYYPPLLFIKKLIPCIHAHEKFLAYLNMEQLLKIFNNNCCYIIAEIALGTNGG